MSGVAKELEGRLRELYLRLESGQLGEREFEEQEARLLDRLDALTARREEASVEEEEDSPLDEGVREDGT